MTCELAQSCNRNMPTTVGRGARSSVSNPPRGLPASEWPTFGGRQTWLKTTIRALCQYVRRLASSWLPPTSSADCSVSPPSSHHAVMGPASLLNRHSRWHSTHHPEGSVVRRTSRQSKGVRSMQCLRTHHRLSEEERVALDPWRKRVEDHVSENVPGMVCNGS